MLSPALSAPAFCIAPHLCERQCGVALSIDKAACALDGAPLSFARLNPQRLGPSLESAMATQSQRDSESETPTGVPFESGAALRSRRTPSRGFGSESETESSLELPGRVSQLQWLPLAASSFNKANFR
jgi:hypothetical protein